MTAIVAVVSADFLNLPFLDSDYHAEAAVLGLLIGALLLLLGVTLPRWWPGGTKE